MRLVKGDDVYELDDEFVAAAFLESGWVEQPDYEQEPEKPKSRKKADKAEE